MSSKELNYSHFDLLIQTSSQTYYFLYIYNIFPSTELEY